MGKLDYPFFPHERPYFPHRLSEVFLVYQFFNKSLRKECYLKVFPIPSFPHDSPDIFSIATGTKSRKCPRCAKICFLQEKSPETLLLYFWRQPNILGRRTKIGLGKFGVQIGKRGRLGS